MAYKFKIVHIDEHNCSVHVNFYSDELPEGVTYNIDIHPNDEGVAPTQEQQEQSHAAGAASAVQDSAAQTMLVPSSMTVTPPEPSIEPAAATDSKSSFTSR